MRRFIKAIAALLGGLTPPVVVAVLAAFGVDMSADTVGAVIGAASPVLALLATLAAPANAPAPTSEDAPAGPPVAPEGGE